MDKDKFENSDHSKTFDNAQLDISNTSEDNEADQPINLVTYAAE